MAFLIRMDTGETPPASLHPVCVLNSDRYSDHRPERLDYPLALMGGLQAAGK